MQIRHLKPVARRISLIILAAVCISTFPTRIFAAIDNAIVRGTVFYDENFNSCQGGGIPSGTLPKSVPEPYNGAFTQAANKYNTAPALIAAVFTEENFRGVDPAKIPERWQQHLRIHPDPNAGWPTSSANAQGPFQFLPSTWTGLTKKEGGKFDIKDINNLAIAAEGAANYLASGNGATKDKPSTSEEWHDAILRYNHAEWYVKEVLVFYNYYNTPGSDSGTGGTDVQTTSNDGCNVATSNCTQGATPITGPQAILCEARKFDKFGYLWGGGHEDPEDFMERFNSAGGYNQPFKRILDCSGIVSVSIWNAFKVKTSFTTASILNDSKNFKFIPTSQAQPGDIMVKEGHMEIATNAGGTKTYGAHTDQAPPADQIGDASGQKWEIGVRYIGKGATQDT